MKRKNLTLIAILMYAAAAAGVTVSPVVSVEGYTDVVKTLTSPTLMWEPMQVDGSTVKENTLIETLKLSNADTGSIDMFVLKRNGPEFTLIDFKNGGKTLYVLSYAAEPCESVIGEGAETEFLKKDRTPFNSGEGCTIDMRSFADQTVIPGRYAYTFNLYYL